MQRTLLDFVQDTLSSMGSDEVNSINDNLESQSVARAVRRCFFNIVDRTDLQGNKDLFSLEASTDNTKPTLMTKPIDVKNVDWIKYNTFTTTDTNTNFTQITYLEPEEFLSCMYNRKEDDTNVDSFSHVTGTSTIKFLVYNDQAPKYWTSFDDSTIFFDAYDSAVDTTLEKSKTLCYGSKHFVFTLSDSFVPPLTDEQQNLLLNEVISLSWVELKQAPNQKAEQGARRGWVRQQHTRLNVPTKITPMDRLPNYGRK